MGVSRIGELLKRENVPGAVEPLGEDVARFAGQRWIVDVSGFMHRFLNKVPTVDNGEHLDCFFDMHGDLTNAGIQVCWVFDGKQTMAKRKENERRATQRRKRTSQAREQVQQVQEQIEAASKETSPDPLAHMVQMATLRGQLAVETKRATRVMRPEYYRQLRERFEATGVPYVVARYEAEQAASWMVRQGFADLVVADDYDCLACHAPAFLQHYNSSLHEARIIHLDPLLRHLRMTYAEFVDFCILCGTDFGGHLPGIGWVRARNVIQRHRTIEAFLASPQGKKYREHAKGFNYAVPRIMFMDTAFPLAKEALAGEAFDALHARCQQEFASTPPERVFEAGGLEPIDDIVDSAELEPTRKRARMITL